MVRQVVWEYGMAVIVYNSIGEENHWFNLLFFVWYISYNDGEYKKGWNWECLKGVTFKCRIFVLSLNVWFIVYTIYFGDTTRL